MNIDASFFDFLLKFLLPFCSAIALVMLLVTGYVTSRRTEAKKLREARARLFRRGIKRQENDDRTAWS